MPLTLHRAERSDLLVGGLARVLADRPADPFTADVVAVPSRGVERWIAQSLSTSLGAGAGSDGVCANVVFPSPGRLVRDALAAASGIDPDDDPWDERRLPWPLLEVIDGCAEEEWCRTLGRHLGLVGRRADGAAFHPPGRRMAVAQKLAGLYTSYAAERPTMPVAWLDGQATDGYGDPLDADQSWQGELWRRLRVQLGVPSPAERIEPACRRLRAEPDLVDLPRRFSLFGPTRLTTAQLAVIDALAEHRDLHLWLPHPSAGLWRRLIESSGSDEIPIRREDPTTDVPRHPLVRSLGRDAREMQVRLQAHTSATADEHVPTPPTPGTLLGALQRDLHADAAPGGGHELQPDDTSIQVHACHGRHRQVEVLREVLLGLLQDSADSADSPAGAAGAGTPPLELRDIIVMCPDIEAYAPLIAASFGMEADDQLDERGDGTDGVHPGHKLTFRLADRSLRQTNPVLGVAARLLELADARLTTSEVLDLVAMPPVRRRFRLDDDALERVGDWVRRAGVRWGMDADARDGYGLREVVQNTWQHGLDRILTGVVMDEEDLRAVGTALPLDDVDSTEVDLAGRLAELLDRLDEAADRLTREQSLEEWVAALDDAVDAFADVAPRDAWQLTQAKATLASAVATAAGSADSTRLRLSDVRALLGDRLRGRPTRANFRTGHLTVCTMVPMRSVPHRVVCLLGLDDGVFPRGTRVDGDDILARRPRVGERDRRSEDRQLFLDAILAAQQRLVVLYTGADERTGAERPPAVPLGELLDVLDRTASRPVRDQVVVRHPLQAFDPRNFEPARLVRGRELSFDSSSYAGSLALRAGQHPPRPFLDGPLPALASAASAALVGSAASAVGAGPGSGAAGEVVELERLIRFLEHPVRGFLRERLELRTADEEEEPSDAIPVAPDALEEWAVGDRMLRAGLAGRTAAEVRHVEQLRGGLPPGRLGELVLDPIVEKVAALIDKTGGLRSGEPDTLDVALDLPSGCAVTGTVPRVYGDQVIRIEYSKLSAKHRIRAWVQLLALCAQWPEGSWQAVTVGRGSRDPVVGSFLTGLPPDDAKARLDELVAVYRFGLTRPLPVPPKTACAYADKRKSGMPAANAAAFAQREWLAKSSSGKVWGEHDDGDHRRVGLQTMDDLLAAPAAWDDVPPGEYDDEPHLFGLLARRIWTPLLEAEVFHT